MKKEPSNRSDYNFFTKLSTRWNDNDIYGHMNNIIYLYTITAQVGSLHDERKRRPIANSFSPENHVLYVWDTKIAPVAHLKSIYLLTNGNGSSLAVDIVKLSYNTRHIRPKCTHRFKGRWCDVQKIPMNPCVSAPLLASSPHSL